MFHGSTPTEIFSYNFNSDENSGKWKGIFLNALQGVHQQVHPSLVAKDDALEYIEGLILNLLATLCASQPHNVNDVGDRVSKTFPDPIDKWAIRDANSALEKGRKNNPLVLPVDKIHQLLVKEVLGYRVDYQVTLYIVAVLEYIAADILKLTGNYVRNIKHTEITSQDIKVAICADQVLMDMFSQEEDVSLPVVEEPIKTESLTYEEIVKDFIHEETQYMRDLNMIIKVFRAPFVKLFSRSKDLEVIFSNILDIYEFTANLLSSVEEQVELAAENASPLVGICFQDMAEEEEFNVYEKYVDDMLAPHGKERLYTLLQRSDLSEALKSEGHGFKDAVKYVLPKLLLGPIYHCLHYFEVIKALISTSPSEEDQECLEQANGLLTSLKAMMERKFSGNIPKNKPWETSLRLQGKTGRQQVVLKMSELQKSIDGWEGHDISQSCSEFILEGTMSKLTKGKPTERHIFLFDGLIVLCKQNLRRSSVTGPTGEFKLKEKFQMRKIEIRDREDQINASPEECKHCFEIHTRDHSNNGVVIMAKTAEDKSTWMAALISLQTRSMLERRLDSILREEERQQPLRLPPPDLYRFAVEDSSDNIVFEDRRQSPVETPLIKGGTLLKLVERLTFHMYADPKFVKTFLTTYRSFCKPHELLDLLIERFDIPESFMKPQADMTETETQQLRDDLKRFRKEYIKPVQFRVVNVLRHWVDHHYYDFERDMTLLHKLQDFLRSIKGKAMRKMADSIIKVIHRRFESQSTEREFTYQKTPPPSEWHITREPKFFDLLTLHPIEIARQVTLLEFDLYRAVQPSELVGCAWMKEDKHKTSPNLLKMIAFTNNFTFWLEKCIILSENFEERLTSVCRILEIMLIFQELNNFNGVLEIVSAINSASVHRLDHTFAEVPSKLSKSYEEAHELNANHFKKYIEKLRSINPPCVPFLGMYLTNILKTEEGNLDFLPNRPEGIINFSKRRKVAEITGEIQQYQNQPYCLKLEPDIREFCENLNPLESMTEKEFNDFLYNKSLEIEPRGCRVPPKYPRKTEYSLKSPGTKPMAARHVASERFPFSINRSQHQRIEEEPTDTTCTTPPTPTTPLTPPASAPDSVFAPVIIGADTNSTQSLSTISVTSSGYHSTTSHKSSHHHLVSSAHNSAGKQQEDGDKPVHLQPPPLPPRKRNRELSSSDTFLTNSQSSLDPPQVPPRENPPPPLPPRRENVFSTLPRSLSVSQQSRNSSFSGQNNFSATLPRCNTVDTTLRPAIAHMFDFNGDNGSNSPQSSATPKLPPKTYRSSIAHSRQQSS